MLCDFDCDFVLDVDGDGVLSWGEVWWCWFDIECLVIEGVCFMVDGVVC